MTTRACGVSVNGTDLGTQFGLVLSRPADFLSVPSLRFAATAVYGRDHQTVLGEAVPEPLELTLEGTVLGTSHSDLVTKLDGLKRFLANGALQVSTNHDTTRYHVARLVRAPVAVLAPAFKSPAATISAVLLAHDPCAVASSTTTVNFTTAQACALGTAISRPVITISGSATNPLITYKNSAGTTIETLGFTLTLGASDTLVIDCDRKTVTKTISSVSSNAIGDITTNTAYTFLALDPADGVQLTSAWPTLQVSSGSGAAVYRKRYR